MSSLLALPSLSIKDIDDMSLLEIDRRVNYIQEAKREQKRHFLKDISSLIFYGTNFGYSAAKNGKKADQIEKKFHEFTTKLLGIEEEEERDSEGKPEGDLASVFGS